MWPACSACARAFAFTLHASERVLAALAANSIFNVLDRRRVSRTALPLDEAIEVSGGRHIEAFAVPGKVALYLEDAAAGPSFGTQAGDTLGLKVADRIERNGVLLHSGLRGGGCRPGARLRGAALVLFDGTLYTDDEMIAQGLSDKTGARMGHISMSGPQGSMAAFAGARRQAADLRAHEQFQSGAARGRPGARAVERAGWEVAHDGMEIRL